MFDAIIKGIKFLDEVSKYARLGYSIYNFFSSLGDKKEEIINISERYPSLKKIIFDFEYNTISENYNSSLFCYLLNKDGELISDKYVISKNNLKSPDYSLEYLDSFANDKFKFKERIKFDLSKVSEDIRSLLFIQSFKDINSIYTKLINEQSYEIQLSNNFNIDNEFKNKENIIITEVFKRDEQWFIDFNKKTTNFEKDTNEKVILTCENCGTKNRVLVSKLNENLAKCGNCKSYFS